MVRRIIPEKTIFIICDIQTSFLSSTYKKSAFYSSCQFLLKTLHLFNIPLLISKHKNFGPTDPLIKSLTKKYKETKAIEKTTMSLINKESLNYLKSFEKRDTIILIGLTTECCIKGTAFDLLENGFNVFLPVDCVSSGTKIEIKFAIKRMGN